jgi:2-keto-4-pentenoate hydratase/2-oxohepta-3-ene-1,7-dioic acid hydratase in catechol pathway
MGYCAGSQCQSLDAPPWLQGQPTDTELIPTDTQLLAPCAPSKVVAVGKNYAQHAAEMGGPTTPGTPPVYEAFYRRDISRGQYLLPAPISAG